MMEPRTIAGWCVVGATLAGCSGAATAGDRSAPVATIEAAPEVQSILQSMNERYRGVRTYGDEGTLRAVFSKPNGELMHTTTAQFQTRWLAPDRLHFEFHRKDRQEDVLAVWTPRGGGVKSLFLGKVADEPSLSHALYAQQGVSSGMTGLIPRWLSAGGTALSPQYELRNKAIACGRATCFELTAASGPSERVTLFIDVSTYALRKMVRHTRITPTAASLEEQKAALHEALKDMPPERRGELLKGLESRGVGDPFDVETTVEIDPTFDRPIDTAIFDVEPRPKSEPAK